LQRRIAVNIATLPELLGSRQTWGVRRGAADCGEYREAGAQIVKYSEKVRDADD
jgi:hypothetical protein